MSDQVTAFLQQAYEKAMRKASGSKSIVSTIDKTISANLDVIISKAESSRAVMTVVLTSLVYKALHPEQDIRRHQSGISDGYSGRTFDSNYITPFLKANRFPSMAESGWLTRSLEQKVPYDENYTGAITPKSLKMAFITTLNTAETQGCVEEMIDYLFQGLIIQRDNKEIDIARPHNLSIKEIVSLLDAHFHAHYVASGASRLPTLAIYALYQCIFEDKLGNRYKDKHLLDLESHTTADAKSGRLGDIEIVQANGTPFEAIEIKFDIPISHNIVVRAKEKIQSSTVSRYYILSTVDMLTEDIEKVEADVKQIKNTHGCQLIVNGVLPTLKYYLRLLENTASFIDKYATLLQEDATIKFEHKQKWNKLIAAL